MGEPLGHPWNSDQKVGAKRKVSMIGSRLGADSGLRRVAKRTLGAVLGVFALTALGLTACSGDEAAKGCEGVVIDGLCEKKCVDAECTAGMKCAGNACGQPCAHPTNDCPAGKYCYGGPADDGTAGQFCAWAPFSKHGQLTGQYDTECAADDQCDGMRGFKCVAGVCKLTGCKTNSDCASVDAACLPDPKAPGSTYCEKGVKILGLGEACQKSTECDADQNLGCVSGACAYVGCKTNSDCATVGECKAAKTAEGQDVLACAKGTVYPKGQFGTACPGGAPAKECDEAAGFACVGVGPGDYDAYCTKTSCLADNDCAAGYECQTLRTGKKPCTDMCGLTGSQITGCIAAGEIGAGKAYSCGPLGLLRNMCIKREFCSECKTDDDCRAKPNQLCASDGKGHKYCTVLCEPNQSNACVWGSAAECAVHDTALGKPTCAHRFGACKGTGKSCEPCVDDADCPTGLCGGSDYSGERYCIDLAPSCDCTGLPLTQDLLCVNGGCPKSPSGIVLNCYGGPKAATSPLYKKCVGGDSFEGKKAPYTKPGCWPE